MQPGQKINNPDTDSLFRISEYLELEEDEIQDYWNKKNLCSPGCPQSWIILKSLILLVHRIDILPDYFSPEKLSISEFRCMHQHSRQIAYKATTGAFIKHEAKEFYRSVREQDYLAFYFPHKDKTILVPFEERYLCDLGLLKCVLGPR